MDYKRWSTLLLFVGVFGLAFFVDKTPSPGAHAQTTAEPSVIHVQRIGVVPFFKGRYGSAMAETLTCPICQLDLDPDGVSPIGDRVLTDYVQESLTLRYGEKVIPLSEMQKAYRDLATDETRDTPLHMAQVLGRTLKADVMALGSVWRYRERDAAADKPAAVGFAVFLVDVTTGKILWTESFSETQRSLSENVLRAKDFFKKGGRWLSASDLAKFGVGEIFRKFPF